MSVVAGIDLGGKRARICLLNPVAPSEPVLWGFEPEDKPGHVEAARRAGEWARLHVNAPNCPRISVAWFEKPVGPHHRSIYQLSLMAGALMANLPVATSVEFVSAGECRKLLGIPANAKKETIQAWAYAETGLVMDQHEADAYVVAMAVLAHGAREDES